MRRRFAAAASQRSSWVQLGLLTLLAVVYLFPIYWMSSTTLKPLPEVLRYPPSLLPADPTLANYAAVFTRLPFTTYATNTLIVVTLVTIGTLVSSAITAYAFAKLRFPFRDKLFLVVLSTLMLPEIVKLVPTFLMFSSFGWVNTLLPLIVPHLFGSAFTIFLLRQFFLTLPNDLLESARVDGASEWTILRKIVVPLSIPALTVAAVFAVQNAWNEFLWPLVFLKEEGVKTLSLGLYSYRTLPTLGTAYNELMAATVLVTVPMIALFVVFQRQFVKGIAIGGSGVRG